MQAFRLLITALFIAVLVQAQDLIRTAQDPNSGEKPKASTAPANALSLDRGKLALTMLRNGEAEARTLPPDLRSYALAQVARGYARIQSPRTSQVLADAFASSYVIPDYLSKPRLQRDILFQLLPLDQAKVMELVPQAEAGPRSDITRELVHKAIAAKKFDQAAELMEQMSSWTEYPYKEGSELMKALPSDEPGQRAVVFARAFASFAGRGYDARKRTRGSDDFSDMIVGNWHDLPAGTVEAAIDEVFKQAKQGHQSLHTSFPSSEGEPVSFESVYEMRLFQLLPILQQLNKPKAERILQDEQLMGGLLAKYPKGLESLAPKTQNAALKKAAVTSDAPMVGIGRWQTLQAEIERIVATAADDPAQSLVQAQTLPVQIAVGKCCEPVRMDALRGVAIASLKSKPAIARQAIADMVESAQDLTQPYHQVFQLVEAARLSLELGDIDRAKSALDAATSKANDAVKQDEDRDNPNLALKGYWPSALAWQGILHIGTRISPSYAQKLTHEIWDDQIRILATIALADELVGAPRGPKLLIQEIGNQWHVQFNAKLYADDADNDDQ
jgi:hypothetical protein